MIGRKILLNKKTGFRIVNPFEPVIIRDSRGLLFYSTEPLVPKVKKFNLPPNIPLFLVQGNIRPLNKPVKRKLKWLPMFQRLRFAPKNFRIDFADNPNKCSIVWPQKRIIFDNSFKEMTLPECFFILYHEFGHHLYKDEDKADAYARNMMLKKGFNKLQIGKAIITSLSDRNLARKEKIVNSLL